MYTNNLLFNFCIWFGCLMFSFRSSLMDGRKLSFTNIDFYIKMSPHHPLQVLVFLPAPQRTLATQFCRCSWHPSCLWCPAPPPHLGWCPWWKTPNNKYNNRILFSKLTPAWMQTLVPWLKCDHPGCGQSHWKPPCIFQYPRVLVTTWVSPLPLWRCCRPGCSPCSPADWRSRQVRGPLRWEMFYYIKEREI